MNNKPDFILASASPARLKLLKMAGIEPIVCKSDFDESSINLSNPEQLVRELAKCKAEVVAQRFANVLILGCDSVLTVGGKIYGKPESSEIAIARWQEMAGNVGFLYTGHALLDLQKNKRTICCGVTKVHFANIGDRVIRGYVASGEPLHCAGSFALEGKGGLFVDKIEGCHSNVIGLSLPLLHQMLNELGYSVTNFW